MTTYQLPLLVSVDEKTFLIDPKEVPLETNVAGKYLVVTDDDSNARLLGLLYVPAGRITPRYECNHNGIFDILVALGKMKVPFPAIEGGGMIEIDHASNKVVLSGTSTRFGRCPDEVLQGCFSTQDKYSLEIR